MNIGPKLQAYIQNPYKKLDARDINVGISEPPSDDSHVTRMELEELEGIVQEAKLPREIMRVADRDPLRLFYSVAKKKGLDPLEKEAKEWADDWTKLSFEFKLKFKRRRPYEVKKEHDINFVVNKSDTTESPSYPSGHAMMGYGVAEFYKSKYPLMADEWDNIADVIAHSRLQMGVHYPSDVRASKQVVEQLSDQVKVAELSKESKAFVKKLINTARTSSPALMAVEQGGRAAVRRGTQVAKDTASAVNQGARRAANQSIEVAKRTGNAARRGATAGANKARAAYYHPDAIQLSQKAQGAVNTLSEEILSKISQDLKTSSQRLRTTIFGVDPEGKLLHGFGNQGFYKFPGGGVDPGESIVDAAKRELLEEAGYDVDSIEELPGLDTSDSVGASSAKGHMGHGSSLTKYLLARLGKRNESLLGSEGDAISNLQTAPIDEVLGGLEGDMLFGSGVAESNHAALSRVRDMLQKTSSEQPFNREQVRAIKDNLLKKNASDLSVLTAVPTQNLDLIMRKGLYSQKAMLDDPEVMAAFLAQRNADKAWKNDEQYDEKRFREQYEKRLKLMEGDDAALSGPSVFFTEPDPDKVSDPRHFINKFDTQKLRVNLAKLLQDIPETRIQGAELIPFPANAMSMSDDEWDEIAKQRKRDLTPEEVEKYTATDPKELWKDYGEEHIGRYYAANVPHAFIRTPSGIIPPEYLERVEKTSSAKEQLKHILVTGHSGAGKTTYARQLAEELGMPLHELDSRAKEILSQDYPDHEGIGWPGDVSERVVREALALDTPHVIEGTQIHDVPDLGADLRRILVDTPEDRVVEQRAAREYEKRKLKNKPYRPMEGHRDAARKLVDYYRDSIDNFRNQPGVESIVPEVKQAALEDEFQPDLTPDDLKALGVYDQVYGDAPSEASMKEWPEHWINKQDPLGWLQWYDRYSGGRRTDDDERQMKRWKSFKARHLAQYLKKPTPRRAAALRNWGIDVEKYR